MAEETRKKLVNGRKGHRTFVSKTLNSAEDILKEYDKSQEEKLLSCKDILVEKLDTLQDLDDKIAELTVDEKALEDEIDRSSEFRRFMKEIIRKIDNITKQHDHEPSSTVTATGTIPKVETVKRAKLPKLQIKTFRGEITQWAPFFDSFKASIDSNPDIPETDKFNYLKGLLSGSSYEAIEGLPITGENYKKALEILETRYSNKQLCISTHMENLMKMQPVTSIHDIKGIRTLYDKLEANLRALDTLGISSSAYGDLLIPILIKKIPEELRLIITRQFDGETWDLGKILKSLKTELEARERIKFMSSNTSTSTSDQKPRQFRQPATASALISTNRSSPSCTYCKGAHASVNCNIITDISARKEFLRKRGRCCSCLKIGHVSKNCPSTIKCWTCFIKDHCSICDKRNPSFSRGSYQSNANPSPPVPPPSVGNYAVNFSGNQVTGPPVSPAVTPPGQPLTNVIVSPTVPGYYVINPAGNPAIASKCEARQEQREGSATHTYYISAQNSVLLQTAKVIASSPDGKHGGITIRVLLDTGCQRTYVSSRLRQALNLPSLKKECLLIKTFGNNSEQIENCNLVQLCLQSIRDDLSIYVTAYEVPKICSPLQNQRINSAQQKFLHFEGIEFADFCEGPEAEIDVLIGMDNYWKLVTGNVIKSGVGPVAIETVFGWVISGPVDEVSATMSAFY